MKKNKTARLIIYFIVSTASGVMKRVSSPSDIVITRSGRRSLPPLADWLGQSYSIVPGSDVIEIKFQTETAEKCMNDQARKILRLPKVIFYLGV